jgi:acetyl-CoA carboxylase carboxyl transferase subunit beta
MSWLSEVVRPKLQELVGGGRPVPEHLWHKCPSCEQMVFHRELEKNLNVCQHCQHHLRLGVRQRLAMLFDDGAYEPVELPKTPVDPLKFRDLRRYTERLKDAHAKSGEAEAIVVASGLIGGVAAVIAVLDFAFMGGSMGVAVGEGLLVAARRAVDRRAALVVVTASGGARMQEGILSLMQMARTTIAVDEVRAARLPYLVVLTDPTTGGVSASFAMLGDITLAEPGAVIGFAGARVIQQTIRENLPEGFQRSEYLEQHGMVDMVVHRHRLRETLARVLSLLIKPQPEPAASLLPEPLRETPPTPVAPPPAAPQTGGALPALVPVPERAAE